MTGNKYGRYQVAEAPSSLLKMHIHAGQPLHTVDHEPKIAVLDQEDLLVQGIRCSQFIQGAQDVNALGSCTANATMSALSNVLPQDQFIAYTQAISYTDSVGVEKAAIRFYHACTDQSGDPSQEWPPTDCGSSGPYIVQELQSQGLIASEQIAHGGQNIVSLLQADGVLQGSPWLNAWESPDAHGFIDGDGSMGALQAAIQSGVAGGHETYLCAIESLSVTETGVVIPEKTVLRGRNSWTASWGDHGCYRVHLSTLVALGHYCDWRQIQPKESV